MRRIKERTRKREREKRDREERERHRGGERYKGIGKKGKRRNRKNYSNVERELVA